MGKNKELLWVFFWWKKWYMSWQPEIVVVDNIYNNIYIWLILTFKVFLCTNVTSAQSKICIFFQISKHVTKSDLSLASLYWSVAVWEIWGNPITGHMRVTLYTVQWKWWLQGCESVTKCSVWYKQLYLAEKVKSHIYLIIIYWWHKVTCLLLVLLHRYISVERGQERSDLNQVALTSFTKWKHAKHIMLSWGCRPG
jgi:hypothetical protein